VGRTTGVTDEQLGALSEFEDSDVFDAITKAVLRYAVAMTNTPVEIPEGLFEELSSHFNERQLVELTSAMAWENYRARFDHALDIGSAGFSEGAYCPLPETV
jgi:alkylhydroperoxidase family enzyme